MGLRRWQADTTTKRKFERLPLCPLDYPEFWQPFDKFASPSMLDLVIFWEEFQSTYQPDIDPAQYYAEWEGLIPRIEEIRPLLPRRPDLALLWAIAHHRQANLCLDDGKAAIEVKGHIEISYETDTAPLIKHTRRPLLTDSLIALSVLEAVQRKEQQRGYVLLQFLATHVKSEVEFAQVLCNLPMIEHDRLIQSTVKPRRKKQALPTIESVEKTVLTAYRPADFLGLRNHLKLILGKKAAEDLLGTSLPKTETKRLQLFMKYQHYYKTKVTKETAC